MLLLDSLYCVDALRMEENQLIASIHLNENDAIFKGHFPGNPITPGVAQLEIIKELLAMHYKRAIQLKSISNCKYLAIMNPIEYPQIEVKITISESEEGIKTNTVFSAGDKLFTKSAGIYS